MNCDIKESPKLHSQLTHFRLVGNRSHRIFYSFLMSNRQSLVDTISRPSPTFKCKQNNTTSNFSYTHKMNSSTASTNSVDDIVERTNETKNIHRPRRTNDRVVIQTMRRASAPGFSNSQASIITGAIDNINSSLETPKKSTARRRGSFSRRGSSASSQKSTGSAGLGQRRESGLSQRRGSLLCERRSSELQLDNADRLSGLMLNCKQAMAELECDFESDYEE